MLPLRQLALRAGTQEPLQSDYYFHSSRQVKDLIERPYQQRHEEMPCLSE
jgi:hypothetical protein